MLTLVRDLHAHAEWANAVFFHTWGKSPARDHEELRHRIDHLIIVQEAFLGALGGQPFPEPKEGPAPPIADLKSRAQASHTGLNEFAAALNEQTISGTIHVPWFPDPPCVITIGQALVQVAMHTQHHRGQCMTRLKDYGGEPKNVDWIIWLWKQKPAARW